MKRPTEIVLKPLKALQKRAAQGGTHARVTRLRLQADLRPTGTDDPAVVAPVEPRTDNHEAETVLMEPHELRELAARDASPEGPRKRPQHRDFVICYDGVFLGHYRSERRINNRSAFKVIAGQLRGVMGPEFDPRLLELYKPVHLKIRHTPDRSGLMDGSFHWFDTSEP